MDEKKNEFDVHASDQQLLVRWRDVPTVLVDQMVGFAAADNVVRVTLGEMVFSPDGALPHLRPAVTIALSAVGLRRLSEQFAGLADQIHAGAINDEADAE